MSPVIQYNTISSNGTGIGYYNKSKPQIDHNIIASNINDGIVALSKSKIKAVSNTIVHNEYGYILKMLILC